MRRLSLTKACILVILVTAVVVFLRLLRILPRFRSRPERRKPGSPTHLLIVLGSGGHTAEMLAMLEKAAFRDRHPKSPDDHDIKSTADVVQDQNHPPGLLEWSRFIHRTWIISSGDAFSALRAKKFEDKVKDDGTGTPPYRQKSNVTEYEIVSVPRARKIHQPLWTSPFSCLQCAWACMSALRNKNHDFPDLILTNGPATATVLIFTSVFLRFFNVGGCQSRGKLRTVYVESWARVKKMSLSGRLLCWVADRVLVQWEGLKGAGGRAEYHGVLCF